MAATSRMHVACIMLWCLLLAVSHAKQTDRCRRRARVAASAEALARTSAIRPGPFQTLVRRPATPGRGAAAGFLQGQGVDGAYIPEGDLRNYFAPRTCLLPETLETANALLGTVTDIPIEDWIEFGWERVADDFCNTSAITTANVSPGGVITVQRTAEGTDTCTLPAATLTLASAGFRGCSLQAVGSNTWPSHNSAALAPGSNTFTFVLPEAPSPLGDTFTAAWRLAGCALAGAAPVARLALAPERARVPCSQALTLSATAYDAASRPVPSVPVRFAVQGGRQPWTSPTTTCTGDDGSATLALSSAEPGPVTVIAGVRNADGEAVWSEAHVSFQQRPQA